jgi:hypothetical protein
MGTEGHVHESPVTDPDMAVAAVGSPPRRLLAHEGWCMEVWSDGIVQVVHHRWNAASSRVTFDLVASEEAGFSPRATGLAGLANAIADEQLALFDHLG